MSAHPLVPPEVLSVTEAGSYFVSHRELKKHFLANQGVINQAIRELMNENPSFEFTVDDQFEGIYIKWRKVKSDRTLSPST